VADGSGIPLVGFGFLSLPQDDESDVIDSKIQLERKSSRHSHTDGLVGLSRTYDINQARRREGFRRYGSECAVMGNVKQLFVRW